METFSNPDDLGMFILTSFCEPDSPAWLVEWGWAFLDGGFWYLAGARAPVSMRLPPPA